MKKAALATLIVLSVLSAVPAICASYDDLNAGIQYYNLEQWQAAIAAFDKAIVGNDLSPSLQFIAHLDRGLAHENLGQNDEALTDYTASLAIRPREALALSERAKTYILVGKFQQAAEDLDTLVAVRPMLASAYKTRAEVNARTGDVPEKSVPQT